MPKMLIISACVVNHLDDRGGVTYDQGELIDVAKDTAKVLAEGDRALYVNKADDHDKNGLFTAPKSLLDAAKKMNKPKVTEAPQAAE